MSDVVYLVMDQAGRLRFAGRDPQEALALASREAPTYWLAGTGEPHQLARANPVTPMRSVGLPRVSADEVRSMLLPTELKKALKSASPDEVRRLKLRDAVALVRPFFVEADRACRELCVRRGRNPRGVAKDYGDWISLGSGFLSDNTKLVKNAGRNGVALGLTLVPEHTVFSLQPAAGARLEGLTPAHGAHGGGLTLCPNASAECKASCLVYTGNNVSDIRNTYTKFAKAKALVEQPAAFIRILIEAMRSYASSRSPDYGDPKKVTRFVRLNVLSDVPWESVARWLFDVVPGLRFYDYTKVPGRSPPPNYDLSFSFGGSNWSHCDSEWNGGNGKRVVMAFAAPEFQLKQAILARRKSLRKRALSDKRAAQAWFELNPLPQSFRHPLFNGGQPVPVWDGDTDDLRPFDPPGHVVGLRWKPPSVPAKKGDEEYDEKRPGKLRKLRYGDKPFRFVLEGHVIETPEGLAYAISQTPAIVNEENAAAARAALQAETWPGIEKSKVYAAKYLKVIR